ncbi:Do family serine endopeptidase [Thiothrix fructosivorans]|uniref:Probable periplasmic serine endoprotease DegP-like n=1 Tax=Thiothrix fructosivorans TaxID=111770 RepID=A0A8B0SV98_9GAMM|nr:Do family serine endopeptidase [Thiothrix fructosivorans]QTX12882.1 Do family serine endopeptidase [Thiothrix fructosivorans]
MRNKRVIAVGLLMSSVLVLGTLSASAETAQTFPLPQAPAAAPLVGAAVAPAPAPAVGSLPELTTLIKQNGAAVVSISVEGKSSGRAGGLPEGLPPELERFFRGLPDMEEPESRRTQATGSGFIISADGYIVTNAHVVEDAKSVTVGLGDRRELSAEIVGVDTLSDIAVLKVKADNLPTVQLGDSSALEVGQWVVAIGAPFGLDHSATQGIVSALSRSLPDGTYVPFIQTDVAVNPGNSGGPLFDLGGRVVGVNSQIYSRSGGYMGISFAIPVNVAKTVVEQLKSKGKVERGWLGVGIQDMSQDLASSFKLNQLDGALVSSVQAGSPAAKAGLQVGDLIVGFGTGKVKSSSDLPLLVGNAPIGTQVPVKVLRAGTEKTLDVTIAKLDSTEAETSLIKAENDNSILGLGVSSLSGDDLTSRKLSNGVLIEQVLADSAAEKAGLETGDVIVSVNNQSVSTPADLKTAVQAAPAGKPIAMLIMQGENTRFIAITKP